MRAPRLRFAVAAALALPLFLGACGDDDDDGAGGAPGTTVATTTTVTSASTSSSSAAPTSTSAPATTTTTSAPTSTSTTVAFDGSTTPTSEPPPAGSTEVALLSDVRAASQGAVDRIVFEFGGDQLPGFDVAYSDGPPRASGSGDVVAVEGQAVLLVRLEPASGVDLNDPAAPPTYTGPDRVTGATEVVTEVVRIGDFEANLDWAIGLSREVPFRVAVLTGPSRIVVEVAAG